MYSGRKGRRLGGGGVRLAHSAVSPTFSSRVSRGNEAQKVLRSRISHIKVDTYIYTQGIREVKAAPMREECELGGRRR